MNGTYITIFGVIVIALGMGLTYWGQSINSRQQTKILADQNKSTAEALKGASEEREDLKKMLKPFLAFAERKFPGERVDDALMKLAQELGEIRQHVNELRPLKLDAKLKEALSQGIRNIIAAERKSNVGPTDLEFILFPQQTPESSDFVQFMHSVFKQNERQTNIGMVHNSGIEPNLHAVILMVKDQNNLPSLFRPLYDLFNKLNLEIYVIKKQRMEKNKLAVSVQRPIYRE